MKMIVCALDSSFSVEGKDFEGIARLLNLPPWASTAHQAWSRNGWKDDLTLHVAEGYTVMVAAPEPEPPVLVVSDPEVIAKASLYSDYHKDFYGVRPRYDGAPASEIAARFDVIRAKHMALEATPEGRAKLRADGWEVPAEPAPVKKVARKAPAKKAARRWPSNKG